MNGSIMTERKLVSPSFYYLTFFSSLTGVLQKNKLWNMFKLSAYKLSRISLVCKKCLLLKHFLVKITMSNIHDGFILWILRKQKFGEMNEKRKWNFCYGICFSGKVRWTFFISISKFVVKGWRDKINEDNEAIFFCLILTSPETRNQNKNRNSQERRRDLKWGLTERFITSSTVSQFYFQFGHVITVRNSGLIFLDVILIQSSLWWKSGNIKNVSFASNLTRVLIYDCCFYRTKLKALDQLPHLSFICFFFQ